MQKKRELLDVTHSTALMHSGVKWAGPTRHGFHVNRLVTCYIWEDQDNPLGPRA